MFPNPATLIDRIGLGTPLIGLYDAPDTEPFEPLVSPRPGAHVCVFAYYKAWQKGKTAHLHATHPGCGGASYWLFNEQGRDRDAFVRFLVDDEGLKSSHALMNRWLDHHRPYRREHEHLLLGPLRDDQYAYLKTVTFYVNPDQLSALVLGANYDHAPGDPPAVLATFGSGCMEILPLLESLETPQALIGATDLAMRQHLPPDILAFTVTKPMYERLCALGPDSFLFKGFWQNLLQARSR